MKIFEKILSIVKRKQETDIDKKLGEQPMFHDDKLILSENTEINSVVIYYNAYKEIIKFGKSNEERLEMENNLSEIKIMIYGDLCRSMIDSLDFFHQLNHRFDEKNTIHYFLKKFIYISKENKVYVMVSGSIKDFKDLLERYCVHFIDKDDVIVKCIIEQLNYIPVLKNQYKTLRERYNLNLRECNREEDGDVYRDIVNNNKKIAFLSASIPTMKEVEENNYDNDLKKAICILLKNETKLCDIDITFYDQEFSVQQLSFSKLSENERYKDIVEYVEKSYQINNDVITYYNYENKTENNMSYENDPSTEEINNDEFIETLLGSVDEIIEE